MKLSLRNPGSALTHLPGIVLGILATPPLLMKAASNPDKIHIASLAIFMISMIALYTASTVYHSVDKSVKINRILRKLDHAMIFILIAGSYTPICMVVLRGRVGSLLLSLVWSVAILGILIKICWITCPKWFSSSLYIIMGWIVVLAFGPMKAALPFSALFWLFAGGVLYTTGGIIYAIKAPEFNEKHPNFGTHEIFHLFVLAGSICHFIMMYNFVASLPL